MEVFTLVMIQCVALLGVIEMFVRFMPSALKRSSEQNCFRVDGTRSEHRTFRERRGRNRLRRDMLAVLMLIFLTGNALYFTLDHDGGLKKLATRAWNVAVDPPRNPAIASHQAEVLKPDAGAEGLSWRYVVTVIGSWALACFLFMGWGAMRAYRTYAEGVNARSAEHFHLDMTRMSIHDSQVVNVSSRNDPSQGVA